MCRDAEGDIFVRCNVFGETSLSRTETENDNEGQLRKNLTPSQLYFFAAE